MKTTLNISDVTWNALKREAARRQQTMSSLVEAALRSFLQEPQKSSELPPLPKFDMGDSLVDVSDRNALFDTLD